MLTLLEYTANEERLLLGMMERFCCEGEFDFDFPMRQTNLRHFASHPECGRTWLIQVEEETMGYVIVTFGFSFEFGGRDSFIDEIYLEPPLRRRGLGRDTIALVEHKLAALDVQQLHLEADLENETLKPFYTRCGFVERGYRLFSKKLNRS